jgi:hypothetical protein
MEVFKEFMKPKKKRMALRWDGRVLGMKQTQKKRKDNDGTKN